MNDLYFFFKISRKKPCSHLPAARKAVFCLFFRLKGLAFRPFVFLLPGPFRHNLLPEASVFGTKAHPVSQLYRTAAAPHKAAQQLHIFFLCVTHGSRQRVHGCFQNKRIRSGKRAQPPHRTGFRAFDGSLCRIQTCSRKQLFGLPGKIGIRAGCLLAEAGSLRIALADSVCSTFLPGLLKRYHALCPQVELVLCTATADGMLQMLGTNQIDLAYTLDQPLLQPNLVLAADVPEPVCFIAPSAHPLAGQEAVTLEELPRQEFLLTERGMSYRDALDQCLAARGLAIHPYLELGSAALLCQMVEQGMGLSFLPEYIVRPALAAGRLARLNVPDCTVEMHRQLFYHRDKWLTPQMKAFIELVRQPAPGTASK